MSKEAIIVIGIILIFLVGSIGIVIELSEGNSACAYCQDTITEHADTVICTDGRRYHAECYLRYIEGGNQMTIEEAIQRMKEAFESAPNEYDKSVQDGFQILARLDLEPDPEMRKKIDRVEKENMRLLDYTVCRFSNSQKLGCKENVEN